jgi:uncharacterized protein with HEPN domain
MKRDPRVYLAQILERVEKIISYTESGKESFLSNPIVQDAVIRNLEVIGEAAKRIPDEYKASLPTIPWRGLAGLRDVLIHQYEGVSLDEVWTIVERDIPSLRNTITKILPPLEQLEREIAGQEGG